MELWFEIGTFPIPSDDLSSTVGVKILSVVCGGEGTKPPYRLGTASGLVGGRPTADYSGSVRTNAHAYSHVSSSLYIHDPYSQGENGPVRYEQVPAQRPMWDGRWLGVDER